MMKKLVYFIAICASLLVFSCKDDDGDDLKFAVVNIQLSYPDGVAPSEGVQVILKNSSGNSFTALTNASGVATIQLTYDVYEASVTDKRSADGTYFVYNGTFGGINISEAWIAETPVKVALTASKASQLIIKELYAAGCPKDDGSGSYAFDQYVILYNNSDQTANIENLCMGTVSPLNSNVTSKYLVNGVLSYLSQGWVPATFGAPYFKTPVSIAPGQQIVVALSGAIDHTRTYSKSVNLANSSYYVLYDNKVQLTHSKYVAPDASIPTSQYLGIQKWGLGSAWVISDMCPAFFIFTTKGSTPDVFGSSTTNFTDEEGTTSKKLDTDWILDGVDVFRTGYDNMKRFGDNVDAGSVLLTSQLGYSIYRNVDKEATEALVENAGKLVYNYPYGTVVDGKNSTDPSGIDAEASRAKGARIIYKDTNNSSNDFHQRRQASLRD